MRTKMVLVLATLCLMSSIIIVSSDSIAVAETQDNSEIITVEAYGSDFVFSDPEHEAYAMKWEISFTSDFSTIEAFSLQNECNYTYPYNTGVFYVKEYLSDGVSLKTDVKMVMVLGPAPVVTLDTMDGNPSETVKIPYIVGNWTGSLPTPTRDGYVFKGWYYDSACTQAYDSAVAITSDTTLYASWQYSEVSGPSDSINQLEKVVIIVLVILIVLLLLFIIFRKRKQGSKEI
jgi:uncharacterized repeat protein (TIGR02543 family)